MRVWDLAAGGEAGRALIGHTGRVCAVAMVVVDGRRLAVSGSEDQTVRVWDLATRQQVGPPLVFPLPVNAVCVAPGGRLVVGFGSEVTVLSGR